MIENYLKIYYVLRLNDLYLGMEKCLQCSKELIHVPGRKQKSFCDVNCRNKYFYAKRKQEIALAKAALSLPPLIINGPEFSTPYPLTGPKASVALHNAENKDQFTQTAHMTKKQFEALNEPIEKNEDIQRKIDEIRKEKIPKERDTPIGRKSWQIDQQKRIQELKNQLK